MQQQSAEVDMSDRILLEEWGDHMWSFQYPRLTASAYARFDRAVDLWHGGDDPAAERHYRKLIKELPEFIDAYHYLGMLLEGTDREGEAFQVWVRAVSIGVSCFPQGFLKGEERLPWQILENRPFLRVYHALGLEYLKRDRVEDALLIFKDILSLNPNDNQGVRGLLVHCYFVTGRPDAVLEVCDSYPGDGMEELVYGQVLALLQLGRHAEAEAALDDAFEYLPLIARELVKERHRRPRGLREDRIEVGSTGQAYLYWSEEGGFWKATAGAIEFVKEFLEARDS